MFYKIKWSKASLNDYKEILLYLKNNWGNESAYKFKELVEKNLEIISQFPKIYSLVDYLKSIRKCVLVKQISLYYLEVEVQKEIKIIRLLDNRKNPINIQEELVDFSNES